VFQVRNIMTGNVIAIRPDATIDEVISTLLDHRVSGLPVVDDDGRLLGIISEIDIIDLVYTDDIETSRVCDHMTRDVLTVDAESSIDEAAAIFCGKPIRRLPVLAEGRLVGILSRRDLIRFVREVRREAAMQTYQNASLGQL
jgi:CBS domain-containing protein